VRLRAVKAEATIARPMMTKIKGHRKPTSLKKKERPIKSKMPPPIKGPIAGPSLCLCLIISPPIRIKISPSPARNSAHQLAVKKAIVER